jgi:uncharacterized membrane protein
MEEKLKSRTFWLAIVWTFIVLLSIVLQAFMVKEIPLGAIVGSAGIVVGAYVGGEKLIDNTKFRGRNGDG